MHWRLRLHWRLQATNSKTSDARATEIAVFSHIDRDNSIDPPLILVSIMIHHLTERHVTDHIVILSMEGIGIDQLRFMVNAIGSRETPRFLGG